MRKGITPIISIIILLLITVGMAATAWTYMSNYMTTLTAKVLEVPTQKCIGGENAMAIVHNIGTAKISIANDVLLMDSDGDAAVGIWENLDGTVITEIDSGGYGKLTIAGCCTSGVDCPKTCKYDIIVGGRSNEISSYCPGA